MVAICPSTLYEIKCRYFTQLAMEYGFIVSHKNQSIILSHLYKSTQPQLQIFLIFLFFYFFFVVFLGLHQQHIKVPRLGVESELPLLAYTTVTAMPDQNSYRFKGLMLLCLNILQFYFLIHQNSTQILFIHLFNNTF